MELALPGTLIPGIDGETVGDFWQWAYSDILSNGNGELLVVSVLCARTYRFFKTATSCRRRFTDYSEVLNL
jgi:hypothetical protein